MSAVLTRLLSLNLAAALPVCTDKCRDEFGYMSTGFTVGTAPFCKGGPHSCQQKAASESSVSLTGSYAGVTGTATGTQKTTYLTHARVRPCPRGQAQAWEGGGNECWTGNKQCCCTEWLSNANVPYKPPAGSPYQLLGQCIEKTGIAYKSLSQMSHDDRRNTVIVYNNKHGFGSIRQLQGKSDLTLVRLCEQTWMSRAATTEFFVNASNHGDEPDATLVLLGDEYNGFNVELVDQPDEPSGVNITMYVAAASMFAAIAGFAVMTKRQGGVRDDVSPCVEMQSQVRA